MREHYSTSHVTTSPEGRKLHATVTSVGHLSSKTHRVQNRLREDCLLMLCVAGRGMVQTGPAPLPVHQGDLVCLLPGQVHSYAADQEEGWVLRWVHFESGYVSELAGVAGFAHESPVLPLPCWRQVAERLDEMLAIAKREHAQSPVMLSRLLVNLAFDVVAERMGVTEGLTATVDRQDLQGCTLETMARAAGMSKYHFLRRFKELTGQTPGQYLQQRRIAKARDLLHMTPLSVKEVSARVGFANPNYLCRLFRRITGMTPSDYRAREKG